MNLTKRLIDQSEYNGSDNSRFVLWDDEIKGFGLRIYPTGKKVFLLSYRVAGRKRMLVLGPYGVLTVEQARKEAIKRLGEVIQGVDPLANRQRIVHGPTVKNLCQDYIERHAKPFKKTWRRDQRLINCYVIPEWGSRKVAEIRRSDVAGFHHKLGKRSIYEANHTYSLLSRMFECAKQWGFLEENAVNPARGIRKFPEVKRKRFLSRDELPRLTAALDREPNVFIRSAFWLLLFTGLRKSELLNAHWDWVDFDERTIRIPDTKAGRPFVLPLSPEAIQILKQIPRHQGTSFIFQGHLIGQPLKTIQKNWERIKREAKIDDLRIHDLRRTVGSWIIKNEKNLLLVSKVLNHSDTGTTSKVYTHLPEDDVRGALGRHAKDILQAAKAKNTNVFRLTKGHRT